MTTIAVRPIETGTTTQVEYRRELPSGKIAVAGVAAVLLAWTVLAFTELSARIGLVGLLVGALVVVLDARYATATRLTVRERSIELGYRGRSRVFEGNEIVARHDVRSGRLVLARAKRNGKGRALARLGARDAEATVAAFVRAGIEVQSR
jgi:hypothetical protein